jgi:ABC-type nitrate/sulfonate/bicarbonate transport system permease component
MSTWRLLSWLAERGLPWLLPLLLVVVRESAARLELIPARILPAPSAAVRAGYADVHTYYLSFADWAKDESCPVVRGEGDARRSPSVTRR